MYNHEWRLFIVINLVSVFLILFSLVQVAQASDFSTLVRSYRGTTSSLPINTGEVLVVLREEVYKKSLDPSGTRGTVLHLQGASEVHWLLSDADMQSKSAEARTKITSLGFDRVVVANFSYSEFSDIGSFEKKSVKKTMSSLQNRFASIAERVEENRIIMLYQATGQTKNFPNDPLYVNGGQDYLELMRISRLWDEYKPTATRLTAGKQTIIASVVMDSGIAEHADLVGNFNRIESKSFFPGESPFSDPSTSLYPKGHGTMVAGIIGAQGNNGVGISGINWNAQLISFKVFQALSYVNAYSTTATTLVTGYEEILKAYIALLDLKAPKFVVNNSFGYPAENLPDLTLWKKAITMLSDRALFVVAAGNTGNNVPQYPCALATEFSNVICVGSIDRDRHLSSFSSYGPWVNITASGQDVLSTTNDGAYGRASGTSFSDPQVSGVAGLIWEMQPSLTPSELKKIILEGGEFNPFLGDTIGNPLQLSGGKTLDMLNILNRKYTESTARVEFETTTLSVPITIQDRQADIPRGGLVTLWGNNFTSGEEVATITTPFPTKLGNIEVLLNSIPIPLSYVGRTQINVHIPMDEFRLRSGVNQLVVVRYDSLGNSLSWSIARNFKPAISSPGFVMDGDNIFVEPQLDGTWKIFAAGLGLTSPEVSAGSVGKGTEKVLAVVEVEFSSPDQSHVPIEIVRKTTSLQYPGLYEIVFSGEWKAHSGTLTVRVNGLEQNFSFKK